ncbi:uncharacterized protein LOC126264927 [Aethina tumida]|uniref:uncharacterized protein LOC126264927 n=1 Tax=Aethina tumida TaxID=116153 RepID=UPI0021478B4E|nr:uncharacterized protein LOC126264927 [Aethina tumida]
MPLQKEWFILDHISYFLNICGFYLQIHNKVKCDYPFREISAFLLIYCLVQLLILLQGKYNFYQNFHTKIITTDILIPIVDTIMVCVIILIRHRTLDDNIKMLKLLSNTEEKLDGCKKHWKMLVQENKTALLKLVIFLTLVTIQLGLLFYKYNWKSLYFVIQTVFLILLVLEIVIITTVLSIFKYLVKKMNEDLLIDITEYYKLPIVDIKKTVNGDYFLIGWIKSAVEYRRNENDGELFKAKSLRIYKLTEFFELFNNVFGISPMCIIICSLTRLVLVILGHNEMYPYWFQVNYYVNMMIMILFMESFVEIVSICDIISYEIYRFGSGCFKYLLDMSSSSFIQKEYEVKWVVRYLYLTVVEKEGRERVATVSVEVNW